MVEPEKGVGVDQEATDAANYVGWLVRLDIADSRARRGETAAEAGAAAEVAGLEEVLRVIETDFRQLTVPLLGRSERVLPCTAYFRLRKACQRWERLLYEKTGDTSLFRVCVGLEPNASDPELRPERTSDLIDEGSKRGPQIDIQIQNVGGEPVSSRALLGRFHPDHREPNIFDALEDTRRLFEERQRKENEEGK